MQEWNVKKEVSQVWILISCWKIFNYCREMHFFLWLVKGPWAINFLSHFKQLNGFSPLVLMEHCALCFCRFFEVVKDLSHVKHLNGFSLVWHLSCLFNWLNRANLLSQWEHLYGLSPVWILSCLFKWAICLNFFSHIEQPNGLSPVWIISCLFIEVRSEHL